MVSPTKNMPKRPLGSLFGGNPVGRALGWTGRPYDPSEPFRRVRIVDGSDDFDAPLSAVSGRVCRDRCGFGAFGEAVNLPRFR